MFGVQGPGTTEQTPPPLPLPAQKNPFSEKALADETQQHMQEEISNTRPALSVNEQREIDEMYSGLDDDFASSLSKDQKSKETVTCDGYC